MSFLGYARHVAVFIDSKGENIGKKVFHYGTSKSLGLKKKTFEYGKGTYNIVPESSTRLNFCFKWRFVFNDYIYIYNINNSDPVNLAFGIKPIMNPEIYKLRLKSKLVEDLNKVASGGIKINWKLVLIILVVLIVGYFFLSGGDFSSIIGGNSTLP